jgi:hypothetical protein
VEVRDAGGLPAGDLPRRVERSASLTEPLVPLIHPPPEDVARIRLLAGRRAQALDLVLDLRPLRGCWCLADGFREAAQPSLEFFVIMPS